MIDAYDFWKTAHVLSAAILFGTGIGIAFFAWFGYRRTLKTGALDGLRTVLRLTVIGDICFTAPAVIFQVVSGFVLMHIDSWPFLSAWSELVFILYAAVGVLWLPVVVIQISMSREADHVASIPALSPRFHRRFTLWFVLGVPAFLLVIAIFFLMIAKPLSFLTS